MPKQETETVEIRALPRVEITQDGPNVALNAVHIQSREHLIFLLTEGIRIVARDWAQADEAANTAKQSPIAKPGLIVPGGRRMN